MIVERLFEKAARTGNAGIHHGPARHAELGGDAGDGLARLVGIADIRSAHRDARLRNSGGDRGAGRFEPLGPARDEGEVEALARQRQGHGPADAAAAAGDQGDGTPGGAEQSCPGRGGRHGQAASPLAKASRRS